jgi:L-threonylcarbamoyladenylate synthase
MKIIKIDLNNPSKESLEEIAVELKKGKVLAYPTDTIYGLGCLTSDKKAIKKIRRIKGRDNDKPMLVLIKCFTMLKKYFYVDKRQIAYLKKIWPGPVSVILKQKGHFGKELLGLASDAAVRLPKSSFMVKMIKRAGEPMVSTSLNLSGQKPIDDPSEIAEIFGKCGPDVIVDIGRKLTGKPSRLIDLRDIDNIKIVRK